MGRAHLPSFVRKCWFLFLIPILFITTFVHAGAGSGDKCAVIYEPTDPRVSHLSRITNENELKSVIRNELGFNYVKFTLELQGEKNTYFQNSTDYEYHLDFLMNAIPGYENVTNDLFEQLLFSPTYKSLSAGAVYFNDCIKVESLPETGVAAFTLYFKEFSLDEVVNVYGRLKESIPFADRKLVFLFERKTDYLKYKMALLEKNIPSIPVEKLDEGLDKPKTYNTAKSYGYLRVISSEAFAGGDYTSKDILVFDEIPLDIGPLSGVISAQPEVAHSHVVLRTINQKIPNIYIPDAATHPQIRKYAGKLIEFETRNDGSFSIQGEDMIGKDNLEKLADNYFETRIPKLPAPESDLKEKALFSWKDTVIEHEMMKAYGAKGVHFALVDNQLRKAGFDRSQYDNGFLIPFSFYDAHVSQSIGGDACGKALKECQDKGYQTCQEPYGVCNGLYGKPIKNYFKAILGKNTVSRMMADPALRRAYLDFAQSIIEATPMPVAQITEIREKLKSHYPETLRIRFRSSTNAEDLPGLNGAGLYESKAACLAETTCLTATEVKRIQSMIDKLESMDANAYKNQIDGLRKKLTKKLKLEKAIKQVYSSLWSDKAFLSRDYYRIPHMDIYMGILVHPSFADESANGVAMISRDKSGKISANVVTQVNDISITNPELPFATPEQFTADISSGGVISQPVYLMASNMTPDGGNVLSDTQILDLMNQFTVVMSSMESFYGDTTNVDFDVEFMADVNGKMLFKQARPIGALKTKE